MHAPVRESLSTLSRDKLQKLIQYAINDNPGGITRKLFRRFGTQFESFHLLATLAYHTLRKQAYSNI